MNQAKHIKSLLLDRILTGTQCTAMGYHNDNTAYTLLITYVLLDWIKGPWYAI